MFNKLVIWFRDFGKGLSVIFGRPSPGEGNRQLARMSVIVMGEIPSYGKNAVRTQVINSINGDMKRFAKKGGRERVEKEIKEAVSTPEYMELLRKVNLDQSHLWVAAQEALRKYEN